MGFSEGGLGFATGGLWSVDALGLSLGRFSGVPVRGRIGSASGFHSEVSTMVSRCQKTSGL